MAKVRQSWVAVRPWAKVTSASRNLPMVCFGVNRSLLISLPFFGGLLPENWTIQNERILLR